MPVEYHSLHSRKRDYTKTHMINSNHIYETTNQASAPTFFFRFEETFNYKKSRALMEVSLTDWLESVEGFVFNHVRDVNHNNKSDTNLRYLRARHDRLSYKALQLESRKPDRLLFVTRRVMLAAGCGRTINMDAV